MDRNEIPNCAALIFGIRDLNRQGICLKFRYGQTFNAARRAACVKNWQRIEFRKRQLKRECLSATGEKRIRSFSEVLDTLNDIPPPPPLPNMAAKSTMEIATTSSVDSTTSNPPSYIVPLILESAKAALRCVEQDRTAAVDSSVPISPSRPVISQESYVSVKKVRKSFKSVSSSDEILQPCSCSSMWMRNNYEMSRSSSPTTVLRSL